LLIIFRDSPTTVKPRIHCLLLVVSRSAYPPPASFLTRL